MRIELEANESGRLWAEDPEAWKRLCTPEACPLCGQDPHPEWILAETDVCKISAWHGNTIPHLHMHLFPRMPGDLYVGYPNHCRARFTRTDEEIGRMRRAVRAELVRQPGHLPSGEARFKS